MITLRKIAPQGEFATMTNLKEVECMQIGKMVMPLMPKFTIIHKDYEIFLRLPLKEELVQLKTYQYDAIRQSHRLVSPKTEYYQSCEDSRVFIHPDLFLEMKSTWKMNYKFTPELALNMCLNCFQVFIQLSESGSDDVESIAA